jgi:PAS domain-containing protein
MVSQSPIAMAILRGTNWIIELANEAILKDFWHRSWEDVRERKFFEVFPELTSHCFPELFLKVFTTGVSHGEKERPVVFKGSSYSFVDFEFSPLRDADGSVFGILVTVYDVSEKVKIRRKTEENEARLKMIIDATGLGTWDLDLKTGTFDYSEKIPRGLWRKRKALARGIAEVHAARRPPRQTEGIPGSLCNWLATLRITVAMEG